MLSSILTEAVQFVFVFQTQVEDINDRKHHQ